MSSAKREQDEPHDLAAVGDVPVVNENGMLSDQTITRIGGSSPSDSGHILWFPLESESLESEPLEYRQLGRYCVERYLGRGGFGTVYLAVDPDLNRQVAIKVPKQEQLSDPVVREAFLREARLAAQFHHPGLVSVYDVHTETEPVFIVLEYLSGQSLADIWRDPQLSPSRAVELLIPVTSAIHYAHLRGLVHRDLKPSNVIMNADGQPVVTDFGLAVIEREFASLAQSVAGTPQYMSPEQVRGETHRLDGRTDVWAIGVMLYIALTRRPPFASAKSAGLFDEIQSHDPKPPRQIDASVHRELERICLRCLSKRMSDRFPTALDLAEELEAWRESSRSMIAPAESFVVPERLERPGIEATTSRVGMLGSSGARGSQAAASETLVIPRGLRSFDEADADFFLSLLPGPCDRDGLPASLRQWKQHIESRDADRSFSVGLLYGPSGCGKSSFVRAGLLPRLDSRVQTVFVEATATDTEQRLRRAVQRLLPQTRNATLPELFYQLRLGDGLAEDGKVLVVFDQFEQWLHANSPEPSQELVKALRQCDGDRLQVLLLVRDDFGMAAVRFLQALEVPLMEGRNYATIDLFDEAHARRVLTAFGRAHDQLPPGELDFDQSQFLKQAVAGLAEQGRVVPVRLALFAEMMRSKPWTAASLKQIGGAEGVGVAFLEECFGHESTNPRYRLLRRAASEVLRGLLPEPGSLLKGRHRSEPELRLLSGYAEQPEQFAEVLRVLDGELRLITPTDLEEPVALDQTGSSQTALVPANSTADSSLVEQSGGRGVAVRSYQLTHDYLVAALRVWFERQQQATLRGRTRTLLERRAAIWAETHEQRQLPSWIEWLQIRLLLPGRELTGTQRTMLAAATRIHVRRSVLVAVVMFGVAFTGIQLRNAIQAADAEQRLDAQIEQLLTADVDRLEPLIEALPQDSRRWGPRLRAIADNQATPASERWHARMALARIDKSAAASLADDITSREPQHIGAVAAQLKHWSAELAPPLWEAVAVMPPSSQQLRVACLLAQLDPHEERWDEIAEATSRGLIGENSLIVSHWIALLRPARARLVDALGQRFQETTLSESERLLAANVLAEWGGGDLERLVPLVMIANPQQYAALFASLAAKRDESSRMFRVIADEARIEGIASETEAAVRRKGMATLSLIRLGEATETWSALAAAPDPRLRSWLIDRLPKYGVSADELVRERARQTEGSVRQALVMMLDAAWPRELNRQNELLAELTTLATTCADASERAAAEWVLRRRAAWPPKGVSLVSGRGIATLPTDSTTWVRNGQGQVFVRIQPAEFLMGSPSGEPGREKEETQHLRKVPRPFWVAAHEVTITEFKRFRTNIDFAAPVSPSRECPMNMVTWHQVVAYCRWLSEQEGIPEDQMVYPPDAEIKPGMKLPGDVLTRTGYRLLTETEWEFAARAGTITSRFFGESEEFAHDYVCYARETLTPVGAFRPNPFGLFDVLGNVGEWCHSDWTEYPEVAGASLVGQADQPVSDRAERVVRGIAYRYHGRELRIAKRVNASTNDRLSINGFRVARTGPLPP